MTGENKTAAENPSPGDKGGQVPTGKVSKHPLIMTLVRNWRWVGVVLLIFALAGTYVWKNIAVSRARAELTQRATTVLAEQNRSSLRLVAIPLVWVVRSEMMRGSFDQLNQYLAQFVKEPNMKEIIVARLDGRIVAATNKKREGTLASSAFPVDMLRVEAITVSTLENGDLLVAAPVLGLNARLGTLILVASPSVSLL
ncbi:MAG: hypothetical protein EG828_11150 [Deltaproteobacteria bacterium]|nr:hypothetical protein [Deltaproteobacteria bacterium]